VAARPGDARAWLELGSVHYELGELDAADRALGRALAAGEELEEARRLRGMIALVRTRWGDAESELSAAITAVGDDPPAGSVHARARLADMLLGRARARFELGLDEGAGEDVTRVLGLRPVEPLAFVLRAELARRRGERVEAMRDFDRAARNAIDSATPFLHRGRFLVSEGDFARAAEDLQLAIDYDDTLLEAYLWHGVALHHRMEDVRAQRQLHRVADAEEAPAKLRADALWWLGRSYFVVAGAEEARAAYVALTELEPNGARGWLGLGQALLATEAWDEALEAFERALALGAEVRASVGAGLAELGRGGHGAALARFEQALELRPRDAEALVGRGYALRALGRADDALTSFRAALSAPEAAADVRWFLRQGKKLQAVAARARVEAARARNYVRALQALRWATALRPSLARAHVEQARILVARDRDDAALVACGHAVAANPAVAEAYVVRARILARQGGRVKLEQAERDLTRALSEGLRDPRVRLERARVLLRLGEAEKAASELERIAEDLPGSSEVHAALVDAYGQLGREEERGLAARRLEELGEEPRRAAVRALRERALQSLDGDPQAAMEACGEALALEPESAELYHVRAQARMRLLDQAGAVQDMARAVELDAPRASLIYTELEQLVRLLDWERAFERASGSMAGDRRTDAQRAFARGFLYALRVESGRSEERDIGRGIEELAAVLEADPTRTSAYLLLGLLHLRAGNVAAAKDDFGTALVLTPGCRIAFAWLAAAYAQEGTADLAFGTLDQALDPPRPVWWTPLRRDRLYDPLRLDPRWSDY
jgi:tetratricopeptide (TPR) repeat protein